MRPGLVRHLICPLHERLLGRRTLRCFRELSWSQWQSPDDLRRLQSAKLHALLQHGYDNTPFYRRRFDDIGADPNHDDPFETLAGLPLLSKDQVRNAVGDMLWHQAPGGLFRHNTGGSTGEPLIFYFDRRRQAYDQAARLRSQQWFGVRLGDPQLYLWGTAAEPTRSDRFRRVRDGLFNHHLLDAFNMSPHRLDAYVQAWNRFRPVSLYGYPSSIALLVEHARAGNLHLDTSRLRAIFATGEVCYPHDRTAIREFLNAPVADGYGARDAGFVAHECPEGGVHITAENVIVEIIRDGRPAAAGQSGEIVVTHLDNYAMPFIRYRTGDVGRLKPGRCPCGRGLPLMDVIEGRATDFLHLPDGTVKHALCVIHPLREIGGVRRFRVTQQSDYAVVIEIVADDRHHRITKEAVLRGVQPVLGGELRVQVELVEEIAAARSGKFRYVSSKVRRQARQQEQDVPVLA